MRLRLGLFISSIGSSSKRNRKPDLHNFLPSWQQRAASGGLHRRGAKARRRRDFYTIFLCAFASLRLCGESGAERRKGTNEIFKVEE